MIFGLSALNCYIIIVAVFAVVYLFTPRKNIWIPFVLITVLFTVLAYRLVPDPADDLTIYYHHVDVFREQGRAGVDYALQENWFDWRTYKSSLYYFYLLSKFPNNHFIASTTIFIVYALNFDVLYKAANRFNIDKIYLFLGSMFFISTYWYYDTASGTRNGLAFAIAFACAYYHLVERKNIVLCCFGYICAALMHSAGFMPVVLVLIALITLNTSGKVMKFLLVFGLAGGSALIQFLATLTDNSFIQNIAGRAENHSPSGGLETGTMFLVNVATFALVVFITIYVSKYITEGEYSKELKRFYHYTAIMIYFLIGCLFSGLVFVRFVRWIIPVIGALMFMIGMQLQRNQIKQLPSYKLYEKPKSEIFRLRTRGVVMIIYVAYIGVHFWYSVNGSSLIWLHF